MGLDCITKVAHPLRYAQIIKFSDCLGGEKQSRRYIERIGNFTNDNRSFRTATYNT